MIMTRKGIVVALFVCDPYYHAPGLPASPRDDSWGGL